MIQACMLICTRFLDGLRAACGAFPDKRKGDDGTYTMTDIACRRFRCFSCSRSRSCPTSARSKKDARPPIAILCFGMAKIPTDNHIRSMLDPVILRICNPRSIKWLRRCGRRRHDSSALAAARLIALDGTDISVRTSSAVRIALTRSARMERPNFTTPCWRRPSSRPGHNMAVPLMPEFIAKQTAPRNGLRAPMLPSVG